MGNRNYSRFSSNKFNQQNNEVKQPVVEEPVLKDEEGNKVDFYENDKGFIEANVSDGVYELDFTGTKYDKLANIISITSIVCLIIFLWRKK